MIIKVNDWYSQFQQQDVIVTTPIVIVLQTYRRTDYALPTIEATRKHLRYSGDLVWYIADDGSPEEHVRAVREALEGATVIGGHSQRSYYGGNCNLAYEKVRQFSPLTFWLEDDWVLKQDVDLTPYAALLEERDDVGMVRLGYLNTGIRGQAIGHQHRIYWLLEREPIESHQLVFAGHPSLRHERYWQAYGQYPVIPNPGETELAYAYQYRIGHGPAIAWPVEWPQWGHFHHIGETKTETML